MKKILTFFIIIIAIFGTFCYIYNQRKTDISRKNAQNNYYKRMYNKEITANELLSLVNKTVNEKQSENYVKNSNGQYIDNSENLVTIKIKFKDIEEDINAEQIYKNDNSEFKRLYETVQFKCDEIKYNQKTKLVNYLHFEEI